MRRPVARTWMITLALSIASALSPAQAAGGYDDGYREGFAAAIEAARQALRNGQSLDALQVPVPSGASRPADAGARAEGRAGTVAGPAAGPTGAGPGLAAGDQTAVEPRDWWNHSSLRYPLRTDAWRHGVELDLSYTGVTGNDDGSAWRANSAWHARLGRWTNELSLNVDKRNIVSVDGRVNRRDFRLLQESLRYDLSDRWYLAGGFIFERDDVSLIDSRITALFGTGYYWIDDGRFRLNTYAALGRFNERYMDYVRDHVDLDSRDSGLVYLYQTFSWKITERLSLRQGLRLMWDTGRSGRYEFDPVTSTPPSPSNPQGFERYSATDWVRRYRSVAAIDIDYRLSPGVSASFGIERRYDSNPWPDVMRSDIVRRMSLRLQF